MFALTVSYKKEMRPAQANDRSGETVALISSILSRRIDLWEGEIEYGRSLLEAGVRDAGADHGSESVESGL